MRHNYTHFASPQFRILSDDQLEELHLATLQILENTGVTFDCREALEILGEAGADVSDPNRVKIPSRLVEQALRTAPKTITLYTRDGEPAIVLNGMTGSHFGSTPNPREILDAYTGIRRTCYVQDMIEQSRIIDALPNIEWCWNATSNLTLPVVENSDYSGRVSFLQYLLNSSKPVLCENNDVDGLKEMIEICSIIAGGEDKLAQKPFFGSSSEPVSPLVQGKETLEKSLLCAEKKIPNIVYAMPMAGTTTPATFAGCISIANAEILSHLVLVQLKNPGAPLIVGSIPSIMDMRTTIFSYGAPEMSLMVGALTELLHSYKLPVFGTAGCTDADSVGVQATAEITFSVMMTLLSGADLVHDVAVAHHATVGSPQLIVLVNEIIGMIKVAMNGIDINEETLPLDLIERIGPGGNYISEKHTLRNFRKFWVPQIFDRNVVRTAGMKNCEGLLQDMTTNIIETHEPNPPSEDKVRELRKFEARWLKLMGLKEYPERKQE